MLVCRTFLLQDQGHIALPLSIRPSVCLRNHYSYTNLLTRLIFGMKAYLINMHLLISRSRSSAKVKVKCKGYTFQKMAFREHSCFTNTSCSFSNYHSSIKIQPCHLSICCLQMLMEKSSVCCLVFSKNRFNCIKLMEYNSLHFCVVISGICECVWRCVLN